MNYLSQPTKVLTSAILSAILVSGCGEGSSSSQPTKEQVQYLSHIDQAKFYQKQGQLKASILEARNAMELQHSKIEPFFIVGSNLLIAGDGRSAEKQFRSMLESESPEIKNNADTRQQVEIELARALFIQQKSDEALQILAKINTDNKALKLEKLLLQAEISLSRKAFKDADEIYKSALSLDSSSIDALIGLSKSAYQQNNSQAVSKYIKDAESLSPNEPQIWLWKAQLAQLQQKWPEAEEAYIKALEDIGSFDIMTFEKYKTISDLVIVLREQGKAAEAFVYEEVLAKSSPGTIKSTYMSAVKNFQEGNFLKAEADLESILDQAPGHVESGLLLGITKYYLGNFEEAENLLTTYLQEGGSIEASKVLAATKLKLQQPKAAKEILSELEKPKDDPQLLALFGVASLASGDTTTGLEYINKSLTLNPENSELRLKLANYFIKTGETDNAVAELKKVSSSSADIHKANLQLVALYSMNNKESAAKALITDWKKAHPKSVEPLIAEAGIATFKKEYDNAESILNKAIKSDPQNVVALVNLAKVQVKQGKPLNALDSLETAVTIKPEEIAILTHYLSLTSGTQADERAISFLTKQTSIHPNAKPLKLAKAEVYARKGDIKQALTITNKLAADAEEGNELQPAIEAIYSIGVQTSLKNGDLEGALSIAKEAKQAMPNSLKIGLLLASAQLKQNLSDDAFATLRELKIEHSDSEVPYEFEGDYYTRNEDFSRAADTYMLAKAKSANERLNLKIYSSLKAGNKGVESVNHLENWIKEYPNSPRPLSLLALHYQQQNEKVKAIEHYERVIKMNANDVVSLNNLAWLYFETNNSSAETIAKKAFDLKPDSAAVADTYGWILFKNNRIAESAEVLKKAYELAPKSQEIALHLAEVYEAQGNTAESKKIRSTFN